MKNYLTYIKENLIDPLSGTTDIKINVDGNKSLINRLIDNMSLIVQKRTSKSLRIKSINGYVNRETYARRNLYYDTYLEIYMINKDFIVGEYKSINNNINIKINDNIVYDMDNRSFDNDILLDKIVGEYKKYLKINKFVINESYSKKDDVVYVFGEVEDIDFHHDRGKVILAEMPDNYEDYDYLILFDKRCNGHLHSGLDTLKIDLPNRCYFVYDENVMSEDEYERKEQMRLKNMEKFKDIDPYGEEEWENE